MEIIKNILSQQQHFAVLGKITCPEAHRDIKNIYGNVYLYRVII